MSIGLKKIGGHAVKTNKKLNQVGTDEVHTCTDCGMKCEKVSDLMDMDCNGGS